MKTLKRWLYALVIDAALAYCFYQWQVNNVDGAGNVFMFVIWFFAIASMLMGALKAEDKRKIKAGPAFRAYQGLTNSAVVVALAYTGHYLTAVAYLVGALVVASIRSTGGQVAAQEAA